MGLLLTGGVVRDALIDFTVTGCRRGQDIIFLWKHEAIQAAYAQRHKYWLLDAAAYYFDNVARCAPPAPQYFHAVRIVVL